MEFVWKRLLFKVCLVETFPSQIVRWRIFLQIYLGRILPSTVFGRELEMFHQELYLWWIFSFCVVVYFENCFVQTSLQRVSGKHVSSIFLVTGFY